MRTISAQEALQTRLCRAAGCTEDATGADSLCDEDRRAFRRDKWTRMRGRSLGRAEVVVLKLSADGFSSRAIANKLGKSEQTVKAQRRAVIAKLDAENIAHAVMLAIRAGILA